MNTLLYDRLAKDRTPTNRGRESANRLSATGDNYQSLNLFFRLLWKEYRQLRPIWMTLSVITLLVSSLSASRMVIQDPTITWNLVFSIPALFSLAAALMFFASEKEQGTDRWLIQWTVPSTLFILAKLMMTFLGMTLLCYLAWGLAVSFELPFTAPTDNRDQSVLVGRCIIAGSFVFTAAASVIAARIIVSAIVGGIMTLMVGYILTVRLLRSSNEYLDEVLEWVLVVTAVALPVFFFVSLLCIPVVLARRFSGRWNDAGSMSSGRIPKHSATSFRNWQSPNGLAVLLWKEYRQSGGWFIAMALLTGAVTWLSFGLQSVGTRLQFGTPLLSNPFIDSSYHARMVEAFVVFILSISMLVSYALGVMSFANDNRRASFLFLTHQGLNPHSLWILKQFCWLPFVIVWATLLLASSYRGEPTPAYWWAPWGLLTAYAVLQLSGILIPQLVVALMIGFCISAVLVYYSISMTILYVPFYALAILMPTLLIMSSFVITRGWMEERKGCREFGFRIGIVAGPMLLLIVFVCLFRMFEIPATQAKDLLPRHLSPATPEEIATANIYAKLSHRAETAESGTASAQEFHDELVEATKRPVGMFSRLVPGIHREWSDYHQEGVELRTLAEVLHKSAVKHERNNEWGRAKDDYLAIFRLVDHAANRAHRELMGTALYFAADDAWKGIFRWAKQPGTSVDEITSTLHQLKSKAVIPPEWPLGWYLASYDSMSSEPQRLETPSLLGVGYFLTPWERERSRRFEEFIHAARLKGLEEFKRLPSRSMSQPLRLDLDWWRWRRWESSSYVRYTSHDGIDLVYDWERISQRYLAAISAVAWSKENGSLPVDLKIATRKYLGDVPTTTDWSEGPCGIWTAKGRFAIVPERYSDLFWNPDAGGEKTALDAENSFTLDPNSD